MIQYQQHPNLLSDSTKGTIKTTESKPKPISKKRNKKVSFHRNVLVYEDDTYSQEERNRMHYTIEEMRSFVEGIRLYLRSLRRMERRSSKTYSSPLLATGLEGFLHPEHKSQHRLHGVLSVLMEQGRQYRELGCLTPTDLESISQLYHAACQESREKPINEH